MEVKASGVPVHEAVMLSVGLLGRPLVAWGGAGKDIRKHKTLTNESIGH